MLGPIADYYLQRFRNTICPGAVVPHGMHIKHTRLHIPEKETKSVCIPIKYTK